MWECTRTKQRSCRWLRPKADERFHNLYRHVEEYEKQFAGSDDSRNVGHSKDHDHKGNHRKTKSVHVKDRAAHHLPLSYIASQAVQSESLNYNVKLHLCYNC